MKNWYYNTFSIQFLSLTNCNKDKKKKRKMKE